VRKTIAREVVNNAGNEVFFRGLTDDSGQVQSIEALSWGNETSTPALLEQLAPGDVVIHHHPSGDLLPSDADVQIAPLLGNQGIGFYIIDNAVENIKVVVKRYVKPKRKKLHPRAIADCLGEGSAIAHNLPGYESRPGQIEMAVEVSHSFNSGKTALIEAGTGTGKTLAYLVPAIQWALNNKERIVVSTNTINLQEQLVFKDIPFLEKTITEKFTSVLVKGRGNYCCLRKVDAEEKDLGLFKDDESYDELLTLIT